MENVPQVYGKKNLEPWNSWLSALRKLGYSNFFRTLNSKDYAIPQNRKRAFMVSVLGDWSYSFPLPFKLRHPLADFLDEDVPESYYLPPEKLQHFKWLEEGQIYSYDEYNKNLRANPTEALTIQPRHPVPNHGERIIRVLNLKNMNFKKANEVLSPYGISSTIMARGGGTEGHDTKVLVPCQNGDYYLKGEKGDGLWLAWVNAGGAVQDKCSPTLITTGGQCGVVVDVPKKGGE